LILETHHLTFPLPFPFDPAMLSHLSSYSFAKAVVVGRKEVRFHALDLND